MSAPGGHDVGGSLLPDANATIHRMMGGAVGDDEIQRVVTLLSITDEEDKKNFIENYPKCKDDANVLLSPECEVVRKYLAKKMHNIIVERAAEPAKEVSSKIAKDYRGDCEEGILTFQYHIQNKKMFTDYQKDGKFYRIYGSDPVSIYLQFQKENPSGLKSGVKWANDEGKPLVVVAPEVPAEEQTTNVPQVENSNAWNKARNLAVEKAAEENKAPNVRVNNAAEQAKTTTTTEPKTMTELLEEKGEPKEAPTPSAEELVPDVENKTLERNAATLLETGSLKNVKKLYKSTEPTQGDLRSAKVIEAKEVAKAQTDAKATGGKSKRTRRKIRK